ncbi:Na+/H+ antiporter NhaC [Neisseria animalis]|uniref:Na+/H+ antiporter NhaC n=1 Tax=Neisseria animalis TaxID=492 RepID=A0A5P3MUT7_NEIAN|nr:Na+/H+ antiporter NhaC [Neisseria animalis]QEY24835.1 Na+/H+ antiporter NhaC [Neisseria animalis]ROW31566.1 Na+/H+ antiporter NhaC [Neisseria animalis]VEE07962.1 NhaC [Neisseria animalis]
MLGFKSLLDMRRTEALLLMCVLIAAMGYTIISLGWLPHISVITAIVALILYGLCRGLKYRDMQDGMVGAVMQGMGAVYLFFFIGLMVAALMMSGAIPTLMYYGFGLISPTYFYFSAFALCSVIGIAIGSSLSTCATVGVAFMGMATAFHADLAMTAGAVVSGAFFGDKMSPLSDTTGIAASIVGVDLFEHIKNMMYTTVPAWLISAVLMLWVLPNAAAQDLNSVEVFRGQLEATGLVHGYSLIPFVLLVVLALLRVNAVVAMLFTVLAGLVVTYFHSTPDLQQLGAWFFSGYKLEGEAFADISRLISRGGLESMFFTQAIVVLGMSLGGLLFALGVIPALLDTVRAFLTTAARATVSVAATGLGINFLIGEQYLSILLAGKTFKPVYDRLGLHSRNLSRTLEDAGTVINPLVPWSVCGVFISQALGVPVWEYLPYAFFCYLCLILTLLFGWTGLTLSKKTA